MTSETDTIADFKHGRVPREVRTRQLVDIAQELFVEKGFDGFSIEELCRLAGISRPVVYDHFGSKDGIYIACMQRFRQAWEARLAGTEVAEGGAAEDLIAAGAEAFFAAIEEAPKAWALVVAGSAIPGPVAAEIQQIRDESVDRIIGGIRFAVEGIEPERAAAAAHFISGAGEDLGRWWLQNSAIPRKRLVGYHRDFITALLRGEVARRATRPRRREA